MGRRIPAPRFPGRQAWVARSRARRARGWTPRRQASEQYRTCSQSRSHFLRQTKGRAQAAQSLEGRADFFMRDHPWSRGARSQLFAGRGLAWHRGREVAAGCESDRVGKLGPMSAPSGRLESAGIGHLTRPSRAGVSNGRETVFANRGGRGMPAPSALAGRRLGLGIINVGFWVLVSIAGLVTLTTHRDGLARIPGWWFALGAVGVQAVFDAVGGWLLLPPPRRGPRAFLRRWARGVAVHSLVLAGVGGAGALSLAGTGGFEAGLAASLAALALGRRFLHRMISGVPIRPTTGDGRGAILLQAVDDPAFTGGVLGPGRGAGVLLPQAWWDGVPRPELEAELFRRRWQIGRGMETRAFLVLLLWNLLGSAAGTFAFNLASWPIGLALVGQACWMTLWTFASLLCLPVLSRAAVLAADRAAAAAGLEVEPWIRRFPEITGEDGSPRAALQNIFYPIPSARIRLCSLGQPGRGGGAGSLARSQLYYSWAAFTLLGRAVHCNVGRPALWVFPPSA